MLWHCLIPGSTYLQETDTAVSFDPQPGESVLLFRIDGPEFREGAAQIRVADLLVLARRRDVPRAVMLYVELKGSRRQTSDALEQLQSAIERIESSIPADCRAESRREVQAIVAFRSETPPSDLRRRSEEFRRRIRAATGRHVALKVHSGATHVAPANLRRDLPVEWPR